jgi:hypothetical protein
MSESLECPRCHLQSEPGRRAGWRGRSCPGCGAPMVLAATPTEAVVRKYLYGHRLIPLGAPPPLRRRG